jgi:hypothetical protein
LAKRNPPFRELRDGLRCPALRFCSGGTTPPAFATASISSPDIPSSPSTSRPCSPNRGGRAALTSLPALADQVIK